jgi:hypothetical protein
MGKLHISIDDEVELAFRRWLGQRGAKQGAISKEIEGLLRRALAMPADTQMRKVKGGKEEKWNKKQ